jgi:hypothetical protein
MNSATFFAGSEAGATASSGEVVASATGAKSRIGS